MTDCDDWWEVQLKLIVEDKYLVQHGCKPHEWNPIAFDHPNLWAYVNAYPTAPCKRVGVGRECRWLWPVEHAMIVAERFKQHANPGYIWRLVSEDKDTTIPLEWLLASV